MLLMALEGKGGGIMCDAAHGTVRKGGGDHV